MFIPKAIIINPVVFIASITDVCACAHVSLAVETLFHWCAIQGVFSNESCSCAFANAWRVYVFVLACTSLWM